MGDVILEGMQAFISMRTWADLAARVADAFEVQPGGLVVLRDRCGRSDVIEAVVVASCRHQCVRS